MPWGTSLRLQPRCRSRQATGGRALQHKAYEHGEASGEHARFWAKIFRRWADRPSAISYVPLALIWIGMSMTVWARSPDRVLRTVGAVHALSAEESALKLPVHLRAVVTYCYLPHSTMFVQDATGGIYVAVKPNLLPVPQAGDLVEIDGVSGPGGFAAIVLEPRVRIVGHGHSPKPAPRESYSSLMTGAYDSLQVEVEGIVRSVESTAGDVSLRVGMTGGVVSVSMAGAGGKDYSRLADARVVVRATAASIFNKRRQFVGVRLLLPDDTFLRVLDPSPAAPFDTRTSAIASLSQYDRRVRLPRRVHVRGRVTLSWPGSMLCVEDETGGLCALLKDGSALPVGALADVIGFPGNGGSVPILTEASGRTALAAAGREHIAVGPKALSVENDARLVRVDGKLMGFDQTPGYTTLVVDVGGTLHPVLLPEGLSPGAGHWKAGSRLRLSGICSVIVDPLQSAAADGDVVPKGFRLLLRSADDVEVLSRPTWWTPMHSWLVVGLTVLGATLLVVWAATLRRTVDRQTKTIRESEERFRYLAQHDALTGLATRALLHERLDAALAKCREDGTGLALLMVDLDHFKAINDTYGHDAGDETLRVTAERMRAAVRECDTVARLGGDEFIVLLTGLDDLEAAERVAGELVEVLCQPIGFGRQMLPVSASVGVCGTLSEQFDARGLLKSVDTAMYRAKSKGRGNFQAISVLETRAAVV